MRAKGRVDEGAEKNEMENWMTIDRLNTFGRTLQKNQNQQEKGVIGVFACEVKTEFIHPPYRVSGSPWPPFSGIQSFPLVSPLKTRRRRGPPVHLYRFRVETQGVRNSMGFLRGFDSEGVLPCLFSFLEGLRCVPTAFALFYHGFSRLAMFQEVI